MLSKVYDHWRLQSFTFNIAILLMLTERCVMLIKAGIGERCLDNAVFTAIIMVTIKFR